MKHTYWLIICALCATLWSCSSTVDEPESEYMGPWEIDYVEVFVGWHTSDENFKTWFQRNTDNFVSADFANYSNTQRISYTKAGGDRIEWEDYSKWFTGVIEWSEIVDHASESEIKDIITAYQSFSSDDGTQTGKYDHFQARYLKAN